MLKRNCGALLLLATAFCGQAHSAQVLNVDNTIHCGTNQGGSNSAASGPLSGSAGPCGTTQSASTSNFGHLSVSGSVADSLTVGVTTFGDSVSAYALASYTDPITILNGPSTGYLRMFYDFSYSGSLAPGATSSSSNTFDVVYYTAGVPNETFSHQSGTFSGSVTAYLDYAIVQGQVTAEGTLYGTSLCTTFVFGSGTDSCSGSFNATFDITGFLVLDSDFQVSQNATIQSLSGAAYDGASATPEPQTGLLFSIAIGLFCFLPVHDAFARYKIRSCSSKES